jgi:hypothetical protein
MTSEILMEKYISVPLQIILNAVSPSLYNGVNPSCFANEISRLKALVLVVCISLTFEKFKEETYSPPTQQLRLFMAI